MSFWTGLAFKPVFCFVFVKVSFYGMASRFLSSPLDNSARAETRATATGHESVSVPGGETADRS